MVVVTAHRRAAAAREAAPGASGLDDVPQRIRGLIPGRFALVGADPGLNRPDLDRREPMTGITAAGRPRPGAGTPVGHGPAVAADEGDAPLGAGWRARAAAKSRQIAASAAPRPLICPGASDWPSQDAAGMVRFTLPAVPGWRPRQRRTGRAGADCRVVVRAVAHIGSGGVGRARAGGGQQRVQGLAGEPGGERLGAQLVHRAVGAVGLEPAGVGGQGLVRGQHIGRRQVPPGHRPGPWWPRSRSRPGRPSPPACGGGSPRRGRSP